MGIYATVEAMKEYDVNDSYESLWYFFGGAWSNPFVTYVLYNNTCTW